MAAAVLALVLGRWDNRTGLTSLIRFGDEFTEQRLPALNGLPLATVPGHGYDGQFYAQLSVDLRVSSPEVQRALDNPSYRSRRILMPALAHVLGFGKPWFQLHAFVLVNVAAWIAFAVLWWKEVEVLKTSYPLVIWCAGVLGIGVLTSLQFSLTDLPSTLLLLVAVRSMRQDKAPASAVCVALACLTRETSALAVFVPRSNSPWHRWGLRILCLLPLALWLLWLQVHVPVGTAGMSGNFSWPGVAFGLLIKQCLEQLAAGNLNSRYLFGLLGGLALAYQSIHVLMRWRETENPWIRVALPFAFLFWVLGDQVWAGYWAVARACLPMTLAFNLSLRSGRWLPLQIIAGNIALVHGVYRMIP